MTLSWNTSRSLARDFVLHVLAETAFATLDRLNAFTNHAHNSSSDPLEYSNIEVGLKMSSYTVSGLKPSTAYTIKLCMKKGGHLMYVSSTRVVTKRENYMHQLGIEKDYTLLVGVSLILMAFTVVCLGVSTARLYRLRRLISRGVGAAGILGSAGDLCSEDNLSTKQIMSSGSEPSSIAAGVVIVQGGGGGVGGGSAAGSLRSNSCYLATEKEKSRLVEHEAATPTEDVVVGIEKCGNGVSNGIVKEMDKTMESRT